MMGYSKAKWLGQTPNNGGKFKAGEPSILVCHYDASGSAFNSAKLMMKAEWKAAAHFDVDHDGTVYQISEIDRACWHAGQSTWKGRSFLNKYSIGIEFANFGFMKKVGGVWMTGASKFKSEYKGTNGVIEAAHKNEPGRIQGWEKYPEAQIVSGLDLAKWVLAQFPTIKEIVGHDDISPGRKSDPGPAFPMSRFQALVGVEMPPTGYVVAEGDTLSKIARKHNTTVDAILQANEQIEDVHSIRPGQHIAIPA